MGSLPPRSASSARPAPEARDGEREVLPLGPEPAEGESALDTAQLSALERELIEFFVRLVHTLGLPKSYGEIYGFVYASPKPVTFHDLCERLRLSKGSASQGLRALTALGALRTVYIAGDRRDHYEPEGSLRQLAARLLAERLRPLLEQGEDQIGRIETLATQSEEPLPAALHRRIESLRTWHGKARQFVPLVSKLLG